MLTDGLITLRPYAADDTDRLFEAACESISECYPWLPWCHPNYAKSDAEEWITATEKMWSGGLRPFAITDAATGSFLGGCGVNQVEVAHHRGNLGYWVRTSATGRGVATSAVKLLTRYGFERLELVRIEILMAVGNVASRRVAEKAGARVEGTLRNRFDIHGMMHDAYLFSLIPSDLGNQA